MQSDSVIMKLDSELGNAQVMPQACALDCHHHSAAICCTACSRASSESRAGKSAILESAAAVWTCSASFIEIVS